MSSVKVALPRSWDTASAALCACARSLGDSRDVGQIAAASGLAFRVGADDEVSLAGPHAYPFGEVLSAAAARLGYLSEVVSSSERPDSALHADARRRALSLIRRGLDEGRPTLVWGVHAPEFGLAVGLEGDSLTLSGILDGAAPPTLHADQLGRGDLPIVFALQLTAPLTLDDDEATRSSLEAALLFGRGPAPTLSGFHSGAAAWRAVGSALASGRVDPAGFAYASQRWAESRAAAAAWLGEKNQSRAHAALARAAAMLSELAAMHPFPPPPGAMFTSAAREQSAELVGEAARAEAAGLDAIRDSLLEIEKRRVERFSVVELDAQRLPTLFACIRELPLAGLEAEAAICRERGVFSGQLLYDGDQLIGHILYAPLEEAHQPIVAEGRRWFVFCPWVARERRGHGAGPRLLASLEESARAAGVDGLLTFATGDERFLYAESLVKLGFVEVARRGDLHLLERTLSELPSQVRFIEPPAVDSARVVVRHTYHCPLLLRTRRDLTAAARDAALSTDEADAQPSQPATARIDGRELPYGHIPVAALTAHLQSLR